MKAPLAVCALVTFGTLALGAYQPAAPASQIERAFQKGGKVRLNLVAGEYALRGSTADTIRVRWQTRKPRDMDRARVDVSVNRDTATVRTHGPKDGFRVEIDLPQRTDLELDLSAGELSIRDIEGNKNLSMWAGEITVDVGDASRYRRVDASVRFGEIDARPFDVSTGGILRSLRRNGRGEYTFRARLFAGEMKLK